jgi:hypothetical protein
MRIVPYCTLEAISGYISDIEVLSWLAVARGNVETRILRGEVILNASAAAQFRAHERDIEDLAMEEAELLESINDFVEDRDGGYDYQDQLQREADEARRGPTFGIGDGWDSDDSCDHDFCLWRRWAGDD